MTELKDGELDCRINVKQAAQYLAGIEFYINRIRAVFDKAGLTAELNKYEDEFKKERKIG